MPSVRYLPSGFDIVPSPVSLLSNAVVYVVRDRRGTYGRVRTDPRTPSRLEWAVNGEVT